MNIPNLMDPIRNFAYEWCIDKIVDRKCTILDIGTRDSQFAAYMASIGHIVTSIERDPKFIESQNSFMKSYNTRFNACAGDMRDLIGVYDYVVAVYALQHNIDYDIDCYVKCVELAKKEILIVNEFNPQNTEYHTGRDDGDMRRYSPQDVLERIVKPVIDTCQAIHNDAPLIQLEYGKFIFEEQKVGFSDVSDANFVMIRVQL